MEARVYLNVLYFVYLQIKENHWYHVWRETGAGMRIWWGM